MKAAEEGTMKAAEDATRCPEIPRWCPRCAGPLSKDMEMRSWTVSPLVRDSFSYIGSALGGIAGAFYGFNHVMPVVRRHIKGPMWMHFFVGTPPVIVFSSACAGLLGGTIPATAQLVSSSYHVVSSRYFARSSSHVATHGPPSASDNMHKTRSSSPLKMVRVAPITDGKKNIYVALIKKVQKEGKLVVEQEVLEEILFLRVDKVLGNKWLRKASGIQPKFLYVVDSFEERYDADVKSNLQANPLLPKITMVGISMGDGAQISKSNLKKTMEDLTKELEQTTSANVGDYSGITNISSA